MALKLDTQYSFDADGRIVLGEASFVSCPDDDPRRLDPYRLEGSGFVAVAPREDQPKEESR